MNKYGSRRTVYDGLTYASKLEAEVAQRLDLMRHAENPIERVLEVIRQPSFPLVAGIIYRADFWVIGADWNFVVEAKGYETKEWKLKRRLFQHFYPWLCLKIIKE